MMMALSGQCLSLLTKGRCEAKITSGNVFRTLYDGSHHWLDASLNNLGFVHSQSCAGNQKLVL